MTRESSILSLRERRFIDGCRVGHLATADANAVPHVVPVCFGLSDETLWIAIDRKPKRERERPLKRLQNIAVNPRVTIVFDRYEEDWTRLAWVMVHGQAEIVATGSAHARAQSLLRARYPQLASMQIDALPVIAIHIERSTGWGDLGA